ncbi:hypothetical protein LNKW23_01430 [Paralimibaculum aggregatum]|uniref:DUF4214 domain-containing protein n=1 Tax=Paralimibaculum aggregatum TaxID=3036245 RepID=A0ABQ6LKK2_9RHOB|nr:hypothetical protein LNKW23_01430 [Limibaculum sp. NKW23]
MVYEAPSGGLTSDFFVYGVEDVDGAYSIGTAIIEIYPESAFGLGLSINEAHSVAYLYEAGLNRDGNIDADGLNFWIDARENGLSEAALAQRFLDSPEFAAAFGDPDTLSDRGLVEVLYRNVLNRDGETGGIDFWTGVLAQPGFGRDDLLLAFAKSPENLDGSAFVEDLAEVAPGVWDFLG